jgi:hypothetical protein
LFLAVKGRGEVVVVIELEPLPGSLGYGTPLHGEDKVLAGAMIFRGRKRRHCHPGGAGLEVAGFEVLLRPTMNIVAFRSANTNLLVDKLQQESWFVSYVPRLDCIRVVIMPHTTKEHINRFLKIISELGSNKI